MLAFAMQHNSAAQAPVEGIPKIFRAGPGRENPPGSSRANRHKLCDPLWPLIWFIGDNNVVQAPALVVNDFGD